MVNQSNILKWQGGVLDFTNGCLIMGILNVTPDSFSDGGQFFNVDSAVAHGVEMADAGAAIIDIGAESTRPGSESVTPAQQIDRAIPVIEKLSKKVDIPISIDTYNVEVAKAALAAGASIINDITALGDNDMARLAADEDVPVILMHMQGTPSNMQKEPKYDDVVTEVLQFLLERARKAEEFGIAKEKIFIDPGIGFGKTLEHNLELLRNIDKFIAGGYRVLTGTSRKSFIGTITNKLSPAERVFGTAATVAHSVLAGVSIVRVHDVEQMADVVKISIALKQTKGK